MKPPVELDDKAIYRLAEFICERAMRTPSCLDSVNSFASTCSRISRRLSNWEDFIACIRIWLSLYPIHGIGSIVNIGVSPLIFFPSMCRYACEEDGARCRNIRLNAEDCWWRKLLIEVRMVNENHGITRDYLKQCAVKATKRLRKHIRRNEPNNPSQENP